MTPSTRVEKSKSRGVEGNRTSTRPLDSLPPYSGVLRIDPHGRRPRRRRWTGTGQWPAGWRRGRDSAVARAGDRCRWPGDRDLLQRPDGDRRYRRVAAGGARVPENISMVGFDDTPRATAIFPADHGRPDNRGEGEDRRPALARSHRRGAIEGSRILSAGTAFDSVGRPGEHGAAEWGRSRESGVGSSRREGVAVAAMSASPASISGLRPRTSDSRGRWAGQAVRPGGTTRWRVGSDNGGRCGKEHVDIFGSAT
jgi:hypothetical protein